MPTVGLRRRDKVPSVCIKCGEPATVFKPHTFTWHPEWATILLVVSLCLGVGVLVVATLIALTITKRRWVKVPFCDRHQHYWLIRSTFVYGGLATVLLIGVLATVMVLQSREPDWPLFLCTVGAVFLVWLVIAALLQAHSIQALEMWRR